MLSALFSLVCFSALLITLGASNPQKNKDEKPLVTTFTIVPDFQPKFNIAGESVDLRRFDMYERFDRELTSFCYTHNLTLLIIKRANRYFPIIEPILEDEGVPTDFIYLAAIESSLNPRAVSPANASGFWQMLSSTGKEYGLEVNANVDERFNIEKSTRAACKYLKKAYQKYGSWMAVAASYNAGQSRISTELVKQQADDVFDLWLTEETLRYPFRMMALKEIMSNPYKYGFVLKSNQLYKPIKTKSVTINEEIEDLAAYAKSQNITYSQLKEFNSWLRDRYLQNKTNRTYILQIPIEKEMYYDGKSVEVYDKNWVVE